MKLPLSLLAVSAVNAQFQANMGTLNDVVANAESAAKDFAAAATALPSASQQSDQDSQGGSGCVLDATTGGCRSFLKRGAYDAAIRPLIQRTMETTGDSRNTQAPMVWMKFSQAPNAAASGDSYDQFVAHHSFLQGPSFPGNSANAANAVADQVKAATSSAQYQKQTANSAQALAANRAAQQQSADADAKAAARQAAVRAGAFDIVSQSVRKALHAGGCARDYSAACPVGWSTEGNSCVPPVEYNGACEASTVGSATADKENFAISCGASWACADNAVNFNSCPRGYSNQNGICVASSDSGICPGSMDFKGMSNEQKANWAAFCGTHF